MPLGFRFLKAQPNLILVSKFRLENENGMFSNFKIAGRSGASLYIKFLR
jgi:hypothetical protein